MPGIESPLGNKNFNAPRQFTIGAPPEEDLGLEEDLRQQRYIKANPDKERMSSSGKDRINYLLGLTRLTHEVNVEGVKFVLRTLKASENREAMTEASKYLGQEAQFEFRKQILARSLAQVETMTFEEFIGSKSMQDKLNFVDSLDETLCNILFAGFDKLIKEVNAKYGQNNPEQAKEVIEDLKK